MVPEVAPVHQQLIEGSREILNSGSTEFPGPDCPRTKRIC